MTQETVDEVRVLSDMTHLNRPPIAVCLVAAQQDHPDFLLRSRQVRKGQGQRSVS